MSWAVGYNSHWQRDIGYGVPSFCDQPVCYEEINRGLSYICGGLYWDEHGCGLVFCPKHHFYVEVDEDSFSVCERCRDGKLPFTPSLDTEEWIEHKLTDPSWKEWRIAEGLEAP
jgi:hypothetical protein